MTLIDQLIQAFGDLLSSVVVFVFDFIRQALTAFLL